MRSLRSTIAGVAGAAAAAALVATVPVPPASAAAPGSRPIADYLDRDSGFDGRPADFDIAERAIEHVLAVEPDSRLGIVDRGLRRATGFLPNDRAFRRFVADLGRDASGTEGDVFREVRALPVGILESAMLFHVVVGRTLTSARLEDLSGRRLRTAEGGTVRVVVRGGKITLSDNDRDSRDPRVVSTDLNSGNRHVAHGVDRVLRYVDLPT